MVCPSYIPELGETDVSADIPGIVYISRQSRCVRLIDGPVIILYFGTSEFSRSLPAGDWLHSQWVCGCGHSNTATTLLTDESDWRDLGKKFH